MILIRLALRSLANRGLAALLTVLAVALSVMLLLGTDKVRSGARASFADTISGTDLIVGARGGSVQLLLYSVFRIGSGTNNITWASYLELAERPEVAWTVPLSLGDSHRGFRVLGTTDAYLERYRYRRDRHLELAEGEWFDDLFDAVVGWEVAQALGYTLGQEIVVSHGVASFTDHDDKPFRISGILARTGTPVDRTVHVSLEAIEAIHVDWRGGARIPGMQVPADQVRQMDLTPQAVTAVLVGTQSRLQIFRLQRWVNEYRAEPLLAVIPGVALQELWSVVGVAERALGLVSIMVVVTALMGLGAMVVAGLEARRREMAILRAVGARPHVVAALLGAEAAALSAAGAALGLAGTYAGLAVLRPWVDARFGLYLPLDPPGLRDLAVLAAVTAAGAAVSLIPALRAWRMSLADGMTPRL